MQVWHHFDNYVAIVTETKYKSAILLDGQTDPPASSWIDASDWGYSIASVKVSPGVHIITTTGNGAKFGAYAYGHSPLTWSSGAYGFLVGYQRKFF